MIAACDFFQNLRLKGTRFEKTHRLIDVLRLAETDDCRGNVPVAQNEPQSGLFDFESRRQQLC